MGIPHHFLKHRINLPADGVAGLAEEMLAGNVIKDLPILRHHEPRLAIFGYLLMPELHKVAVRGLPNNLSGGQQQRVAIARALITKPAIVLADEPTGNLDSKTSAEVLGLIKRTSAEFRQTVVMITHNNDIARLADRIVRIEDGKIVE